MKTLKALIIFIFSTHFVLATHIQGSEIHTTHLSGNEYRIDIVSHYKLIGTLPFIPEPFQLLKIYQRSNGINLVKIDSIPFHSIDTIIPSACVPLVFFDVMLTYSDTLVFDSISYNSPGGYLLVQSTIGTTNYSNSTQTVQEIYSLIPPSYDSGIQIINSSPKPNNLMDRPIICTNEEFMMDLSATDADGDSLSYRFFTPASIGAPAPGIMNVYSAPYDYPPTQFNQIQWVSGFSELNQINGASPNASANQLKLDSITGEMTVKAASQTGRFLVAVAVEEFRDIDNDGFKELIGAVYRVLAFEVDNCTWKVNDPPQMDIAMAPSNSIYSCNTPSPPGSNVFNVCVDSVNEFVLTLTDNNPFSTFKFDVEGLNANIQDSTGSINTSIDTIKNSIFLSASSADIGSLKKIKVNILDSSLCVNAIQDSIIFYINAQLISSLESNNYESNVVYPNPANDILTISGISETALFEIFDFHGRKIKSEQLTPGNNTINTTGLKEGLYFYQYQNQRGKFLIQR